VFFMPHSVGISYKQLNCCFQVITNRLQALTPKMMPNYANDMYKHHFWREKKLKYS